MIYIIIFSRERERRGGAKTEWRKGERAARSLLWNGLGGL
jgi:hypothetical protein